MSAATAVIAKPHRPSQMRIAPPTSPASRPAIAASAHDSNSGNLPRHPPGRGTARSSRPQVHSHSTQKTPVPTCEFKSCTTGIVVSPMSAKPPVPELRFVASRFASSRNTPMDTMRKLPQASIATVPKTPLPPPRTPANGKGGQSHRSAGLRLGRVGERLRRRQSRGRVRSPALHLPPATRWRSSSPPPAPTPRRRRKSRHSPYRLSPPPNPPVPRQPTTLRPQ